MIIKKIVFMLFSAFAVECCAQDLKDKEMKVFDAFNNHILTHFKSNGSIDSTLYWNSKGNKLSVNFEYPNYKFGMDSIQKLLLLEFREKVDVHDVNGAALLYVLVEENHKISEARIVRRYGYPQRADSAIIQTLLLSEKEWLKLKNEKPTVFPLLFKME
ncbi:hypothetical protein E7Z59_12665 [Robertkochia marina]|uniref:TonB C-terminal domain-containing protein n=1 Tax=Robertkochia marina TaxID=1227945 RepID=A0A4S3LZB0_9FLAO|nr:hypothetical protein [Robertkochia marina]THD66635.1 hypothetical protein E7Z59_12665 [Robertkochia marina]TRZ45527.1 hypothetical protein D3A96_05965 [Robertkochia marina]